MRRSLKLALIGVAASLGLAGCVAYPVGPDTYVYEPAPAPYYAPSVVVGSTYYYDGPRYYSPGRYYGHRYHGGPRHYYGGGGRHYSHGRHWR